MGMSVCVLKAKLQNKDVCERMFGNDGLILRNYGVLMAKGDYARRLGL